MWSGVIVEGVVLLERSGASGFGCGELVCASGPRLGVSLEDLWVPCEIRFGWNLVKDMWFLGL